MSVDIFILIPISGQLKNKKLLKILSKEEHRISDIAIKTVEELKNRSKIECDEFITNALKRIPLEKVRIAYYENDIYEIYNSEKKTYEERNPDDYLDTHISLLYLDNMELGLLQIFIPEFTKRDITSIGDMISRKKLRIREQGKWIEIHKYMQDKLGFDICGNFKTIYCMGKGEVQKNLIQYMLVGEIIESTDVNYPVPRTIDENEIVKMSENDLGMYDNYELYASSKNVVYCLKEFNSMCIEERLKEEALLLFICEIAILQNSALNRINRLIVNELLNDSNISSQEALKLQVKYGKTVLLWDNKIYNYYTAQKLSDKITEIFETPKLFNEYKKNKEHIEQISAQKNNIWSGRGLIILNIVTFVLNIYQLNAMIQNPKRYIPLITIICFCIIIFTVLIRNRRKIKKLVRKCFSLLIN